MSSQASPRVAFHVSVGPPSRSSLLQAPVRHYTPLPLSFCLTVSTHEKSKRSPLFSGASATKKKKEKKKSLSSIFSALFLIVAWATIHAYVWRLCAINYVVLRSQALAGDNSHPHISDLWAIYHGAPLLPRQPLSNAQDHNNVIPPRVIAPICAESTCISVNVPTPLFLITYHNPLHAVPKRGKERKKAHKDKNHISLEGACVTVIYAVSILPPHWDGSEFWVAKSICAKAVGASIGVVIWSLLSIFRGQRERKRQGHENLTAFSLVSRLVNDLPQEDCG